MHSMGQSSLGLLGIQRGDGLEEPVSWSVLIGLMNHLF